MRKPNPAFRSLAVVLVLSLIGCSSTTVIRSRPSGAKLYLQGEYVGTTPYTMSDTKIVGSTTSVRLEHPGYEPLVTSISRNEEVDVGACIAGIFFLFPFLWILKYKGEHSYELHPLAPESPPAPQGQP